MTAHPVSDVADLAVLPYPAEIITGAIELYDVTVGTLALAAGRDPNPGAAASAALGCLAIVEDLGAGIVLAELVSTSPGRRARKITAERFA